mgnify:CR=1 FL=1
MQRNHDLTAQLVVGERIVGAGRVAVPINEAVMPHIFVAEASRGQDRTDGALEVDALPSPIKKTMVMGKVRIAAHKV